jgi:ABC-type multidrug transport system fused ATPase/permease subunit
VTFLLLVPYFFRPIQDFGRLTDSFMVSLAAADRLHDLLSEKPEIADAPNAVDLGGDHPGIVFDHVSFSYSGRRRALRGLALEVRPRETLALVGPSGAGKSTIANLIPRFYDPQRGSVNVGGRDVRTCTKRSLRTQIAIVPQDPFLFDATIRENIAYGKPGATDREIRRAARLANAHRFIDVLPQRYNTIVGERGVRLSGGQKQRVAIARAILKDAPILLLDEATSSMDTATEMEIQQALERLRRHRTTIIIAHRLSTVRRADRIAVVEQGRIVEIGSHAALLRKPGGVYRRLLRMQETGHSGLWSTSEVE